MVAISWGQVVALAPSEVNVDPGAGFQHFWEAFGNVENDITAAWLVRFAQNRGSWEPFMLGEVDQFFVSLGRTDRMSLVGLVDEGIIIVCEGQYYFTYEFVGRVYGASPAIKVRPVMQVANGAE